VCCVFGLLHIAHDLPRSAGVKELKTAARARHRQGRPQSHGANRVPWFASRSSITSTVAPASICSFRQILLCICRGRRHHAGERCFQRQPSTCPITGMCLGLSPASCNDFEMSRAHIYAPHDPLFVNSRREYVRVSERSKRAWQRGSRGKNKN
jgi:hypothetical protein